MINFTFVKCGFKRAGFGHCTSKFRQKLQPSCLHYNIHVIINVWFNLTAEKKSNALLLSYYLYVRGLKNF